MIKAWESGGELTVKNGEVQKCSIIKYCESEDKLEWETVEKNFLLSITVLQTWSGRNYNHLCCSVLCIIWSAEVNHKGSSCNTAVTTRTYVQLRVALKPKNLFKEVTGQLLQTSEVVVLGADISNRMLWAVSENPGYPGNVHFHPMVNKFQSLLHCICIRRLKIKGRNFPFIQEENSSLKQEVKYRLWHFFLSKSSQNTWRD